MPASAFEELKGSPAAAITVLMAAAFDMQDVVEMLVLHGAETMDNDERKFILFMASIFGWASRPECVVWMDKLVKAGVDLKDLVSRTPCMRHATCRLLHAACRLPMPSHQGPRTQQASKLF